MKTSSIVAAALFYLTAGVTSLPSSLPRDAAPATKQLARSLAPRTPLTSSTISKRDETRVEESVKVRLDVEVDDEEVEVEIDIEIDVLIDTRHNSRISEVFEAEIIAVSDDDDTNDYYCDYYSDYKGKEYLGRFTKKSHSFGRKGKHIGAYKCGKSSNEEKRSLQKSEESVRVRLDVEINDDEEEVEIEIEIDVLIDTRRNSRISEVFEAVIISVSEGLDLNDVYCDYYSDYQGKNHLGRFTKGEHKFGKKPAHIGAYKCHA